MSSDQKDTKLFASSILLVLLHGVGLAGLLSSHRELFLQLSSLNLLLSAVLLFINHKDFNFPFITFCSITFSAGFFIELLGVTSGSIFGEYSYGNTLGFKIAGIPVIIGLNWLMLAYSTGVICNGLRTNVFVKSILAALMMLLLDFFIEPVAVKYDFWSWNSSAIPIQNYIAWFIASFILLILFYRSGFEKENRMARALYIVQLVFFILLGIF